MANFGELLTWSPDRSQELCNYAMVGSSSAQPETMQPMPGGRWDESLELERTQDADFKISSPCVGSVHGISHGKSNGRFESSGKSGVIPKGIFTIPYLLHAYDVTRSSFRRRMKDLKEG
jgi:hypothetical protein